MTDETCGQVVVIITDCMPCPAHIKCSRAPDLKTTTNHVIIFLKIYSPLRTPWKCRPL